LTILKAASQNAQESCIGHCNKTILLAGREHATTRRKRHVADRAPPSVSILMPTYEQSRSIKRALDSLQAQTLTDWEAILLGCRSWHDLAGQEEAAIRLRADLAATSAFYL
jgi:hypothetical protein